MNDILPLWLTNTATISSILGLIVTGFLLYEAKEIRNSFLRRARLPEIIKEITQTNKKFSKCLKDWESEQRTGIEQLSITKSLLVNLSPKLPDAEKQTVLKFIKTLEKRNWYFVKTTISQATENEAWDLYKELTGIITTLNQLLKDSKWD